MDAETSENFIFGALIGGAIGATAALILAPMSGESLRRKISSSLNLSPPKGRAQKTHSSEHHKDSRDRSAAGRRSPGSANKKMKEQHHKFEEDFSRSARPPSRSRSSSHPKSSPHRSYK